MKLTGQNVPEEIREAYSRLLSPHDRHQVAQAQVRTRKRAKKTKSPAQRKQKTKADIYAVTVEGLAHSFGKSDMSDASRAWRRDRLYELLTGVINLTYWQPIYPAHQAIWQCTPSIGPDETPAPYLYRIDENWPTKPTYTGGILILATEEGEWPDDPPPLAYFGSTSNRLFHDDSLLWTTLAFQLPMDAGPPNKYPILFCPVINITAECDARGSRSMFSYLWKFVPLLDEPDITATGANPLTSAKSTYWRYKPPQGVAPYYHASASRHDLIVPFRNEVQSNMRWFLATLAPRPMLGHGFNNNTTVSTTMTHAARVYVPKRTIRNWRYPCFNRPLGVVRLYAQDLQSYVDWNMQSALPAQGDPPPNTGVKIRTHIGGVLVTSDAGPLVSIWQTSNTYAQHPNRPGVEIIGSYHDGLIMTQGITLDGNGNEHQQLYYSHQPTEYWLMADGTPEQMAPFVAMEFIGGFTNGMIVNDAGVAMNLHLSSITYPSFTGNGTPPVFWDNTMYRQGPDGQWWQFDPPQNNGGTLDDMHSGSPWGPLYMFGNPTPQPGRAWPCGLGIMLPRPFGSPTTHHVLTWEGALREINLIGANDSDYMGTI